MDFIKQFFNEGLSFIRPLKDLSPYKVYKVEDGYIIVANTLGIPKDKIEVTLDDYAVLTIKGKTIQTIPYKSDGEKSENDFSEAYEQNIRIGIPRSIYTSMEGNIDVSVKDGITTIHIKTKQQKSKFNINII